MTEDFDDETLVDTVSTRTFLDGFRSSLANSKGGNVVQHRRAFLASMLGAASLAVTENFVSAASAEATTIETSSGAHGALIALEGKVFDVGRAHMRPGQNPDDLITESLRVWRDSCALRHTSLATMSLNDRAARIEATSAGLVAQFLGDQGKLAEAEHWYRAALKIAPDDDTRSWLYGCRTWLYLYEGDERGAKNSASRAAALATYFNRDRASFGYHQLARAYALGGDYDKAREHLSNATTSFLFSSGTGNPNAEPNLLNWTLLQNSQYTMDTVAILAYGHGGRKSDIGRFYTNANLVFDKVSDLNGMNAFLVRMADAKIKASGERADPDAAVETCKEAVRSLRLVDRNTAVIKGRARQFADDMELNFGETSSVRGLRGFVHDLAA